MQSWFKKITKENRNKKRKQNVIESSEINLIFSIILLPMLCFLFFYSITNASSEYGIIITIISLIVTYSFEAYEWIYLFKKDKSKKHELVPIPFAFIFIIFFIIIVFINKDNLFRYKDYNNMICTANLLIYIVLITIRKIIIDIKNNH